MKLSLNIGGRSIANGTALMIVLSSAPLIRANEDDALDAKQTAKHRHFQSERERG
jgi:hypothetical protein